VYNTESYKYLSDWEKKSIYDLYHDYFFKRQDHLWYEKAMEKLPMILNATEKPLKNWSENDLHILTWLCAKT
jgi:4-alpha-glucanotransferase